MRSIYSLSSRLRLYFNTVGNPRVRPNNARLALLGVLGGGSFTLSFLASHVLLKQEDAGFSRNTDKSKAIFTPSHTKTTGDFSAFPVDIDGCLRKYEQTYFPDPETGIVRYDIAQFASNDPIEDDHAEAIIPIASGFWSFFTVLDGHSGWETSAWLRDYLIPAVVGSLADLYSKLASSGSHPDVPPSPTTEDVESTIKDTFMRLDDDIVHSAVENVLSTKSRHTAVTTLSPAYAGSCTLLAFYDSHAQLLRIAITGDSRAVLGRRSPTYDIDGTYEVRVLSVEQNGHNAAEEARLNASHPGEAVVKNGRVLGLGVSRAFGDALYKWGLDVQRQLKQFYLGRTPLSSVRTPPYLTAEPEVTAVAIRPGDFLILGTDGLWECLSSAEAVGLVGLWLNRQKVTHQVSDQDDVACTAPRDLPVKLEDGVKIEDEDDTVRYAQWGASKLFTAVDQNAATHLLRNATGGADKDLASAILSMRSPRARTYIDDITATVVFF